MITGMGKAQPPGPDSRVENPQDVEVTGDLPTSLTTFVGRERELDELRSLFRDAKRLVTLVGIGGIGKTRLAVEMGFSASDLGWANVYFVELASLADPGLVDGAVLELVGGGSSRFPLQAAVEHLREATALLVLDCCEHVLNAARRVAEVLLRSCPSVAILATSRSPLDIAGELVWPVPPLSMQERSDPGEAGASDAARLFADRASYVQPRFELSEEVAGAVETIVRRVDGIPLAIELAAARVRVLSAEEIASGLDDHLRLLRGGHQSDPRHQTIRASLDWSHELLTDRERQLFARLAVFSGGFNLEAATTVCAGEGMASVMALSGAIAPGIYRPEGTCDPWNSRVNFSEAGPVIRLGRDREGISQCFRRLTPCPRAARAANQAEPLRSVQPNGRGNRPSSVGARDTSGLTGTQPFRHPMPGTAGIVNAPTPMMLPITSPVA